MRRQTFERDSVMLTINTEERRGHVVVFNYGAVVFFNVPQNLRDWCLDAFAPFCGDTIPDGFRQRVNQIVTARPRRHRRDASSTHCSIARRLPTY